MVAMVAAMPLVAQRTRACVPPEMMQFVARRRQLGPTDYAAVRRGVGVAVHHGERILQLARRVERSNIGDLLARSRGSGAGAAVKRGICRMHYSSSARPHSPDHH